MTRLKHLFSIIILLFSFACSSSQISEKLKTAEKTVLAQISNATSEKFCESYFETLPEKYFSDNNGEHIFLLEKIPVLEYSDTLEITVKNASVQNFEKLNGIPDCVADERNCVFSVDKKKLLEILTKNGLLETNNELIAKAYWDKTEKRFLWKATVTKEKFEVNGNVRGNGLYVTIHPATGEILKTETWQIN